MKLTYPQLSLHLKNSLLPIYLLSGDEYFLVQEARDLIRSKAKNQGFTEIQRFDANKEFDWNKLIEATQSLSLFSEKIYLEIKLTQKPNPQATKLVCQFIENLGKDHLVVIWSEKLDAATGRTSWFNLIANKGAHIAIWPLDLSKFQDWVMHRLKRYNLRPDQDAIQLLINQTEGNLLACAQEIEKLALLFDGPISLTQMVTAISDNAHFDVFDLTEAILDGSTKQALRILDKLCDQDTEPTLVLWAIIREIRLLITIKTDLRNNVSWGSIFKKNHIWDRKQALIKKMIHGLQEENLHQLLVLGGKIDCMIKGIIQGNSWNEMQTLVYILTTKEKVVHTVSF